MAKNCEVRDAKPERPGSMLRRCKPRQYQGPVFMMRPCTARVQVIEVRLLQCLNALFPL